MPATVWEFEDLFIGEHFKISNTDSILVKIDGGRAYSRYGICFYDKELSNKIITRLGYRDVYES